MNSSPQTQRGDARRRLARPPRYPRGRRAAPGRAAARLGADPRALVRHLRLRPARIPGRPGIHPRGGAAPAHRPQGSMHPRPRVQRRNRPPRQRRDQLRRRPGGRRQTPASIAAPATTAGMGCTNICENLAFTGLMNNGAFAEYVNVPANLLYALPAGFPSEAGALIGAAGGGHARGEEPAACSGRTWWWSAPAPSACAPSCARAPPAWHR